LLHYIYPCPDIELESQFKFRHVSMLSLA
jgi:hypothetical protein